MEAEMVTVKMEQADINGSHYCESCPLATAMSRAMGKPIHVGISDYWAPGTEEWRRLPLDASRWRQEYDAAAHRSACVYPAPITFHAERI